MKKPFMHHNEQTHIGEPSWSHSASKGCRESLCLLFSQVFGPYKAQSY